MKKNLFIHFFPLFPLFALLISACSNIEKDTLTAENTPPPYDLWIKDKILQDLPMKKVRYKSSAKDLNNDGKLEHFILIQDRYFCGSGGCSAFIFNSDGKILQRMTVVDIPILLDDNVSGQWRDFIVWSNGEYRLMRHNGNSYPSNPSIQPVVDRDTKANEARQLVKKTELYQQDGYDLQQVGAEEVWASANLYHFMFKHYGDTQRLYYATVNIKTKQVEIASH